MKTKTNTNRERERDSQIQTLADTFIREQVLVLEPGALIGWHDMDRWANANCPDWARKVRGYDVPYDILTVELMVRCEALHESGKLERCDTGDDDYGCDVAARIIFGCDRISPVLACSYGDQHQRQPSRRHGFD
jgi:hypothetical protein